MSQFFSMIQVLKVDEPVEKKGKDGGTYTIHAAQTALLDDSGELQKVGRLRIPESMREKVKVGTFRAQFSLEVAQWGQNKGDVIASLTDLMPLSPKSVPPAAAAAAAPKS